MSSSFNPAQVRLKQITHYIKYVQLEESWDWKMGNHDSLKEYIHNRLNKTKTVLYWVIVNNDVAGITGFLPHPDYVHLQTITFIAKNYRGKNLNNILKHSFSQAFNKVNIKLIASVDSKNVASMKALNKITDTCPEKVWEPKKGRTAFLYNITNITPTETSNDIVATMQRMIKTMES
jgi:RimJ/RimL family protein N-acetyltransferase